ncbi:MAG: DNA mismatch repair protein MutS [Planctomycetes bacterium]|jgi:DNA mismatch repair protein MutS|nr:DNA mismatch repair protein MutS [Planctomycetota bacterium]
MSEAATTPAMAQYLAQKQRHPDALLFFRMGDFYELFFDDAKTAAKALGITLTSRSKGEGAIPMAGVPYRAIDGYLRRLVQMGHKVAICEQLQDPKDAKGVVERAVVRVVTPGTLTEDNLLDGRRDNHLAAIAFGRDRVGIAWVELSTGAFRVHECALDRLGDELARIEPAELLLPEAQRGGNRPWLGSTAAPLSFRADFDFGTDGGARVLQQFFRTATLAGFGLSELPLAIGAAGALVTYLQETQLCALPHLRGIEVWHDGSFMRLDRATRQSLELVQTMRDAEGTSLLSILDRTSTPMGARLLRHWLLAPLAQLPPILRRQEAVGELFDDGELRTLVTTQLGAVLDLERLSSRAAFGRANGRDLQGLRQSLDRLPAICARLRDCRAPRLCELAAAIDPLPDLAHAIGQALVDDPPLTIKEGGVIREGHHQELDELRTLARDSSEWLARYQGELVERTGISSLKVGFNKVFGYYIEITHTHREVALPPEFVRKQTTKNAERYVTDALRTFETKVLKAEENGKALEYELFTALREQVAAAVPRLQRTAQAVAELDALAGLATVARERDYCRPVVDDSLLLRIEDGRHPVIESTHAAGSFVANDTDLEPPGRRLVLLTGPNMAGKSTWIRQNALIVVMAQIGSFVPAKAAHIGLVDRVFTRVGGADDISRGASTFMVEMTETANILNHATARSLVVLDEVGRGTSTYDGMSLAWAIAEDLHDRIRCRGLFATHYHQLMDLAGPGRGIVNCRVAVREWGDEIVFLHRIEQGGTDRSYGLHVARLAGIPKAVLERAKTVLEKLDDESGEVRETLVAARDRAKPGLKQKELFAPPPDPIVEELRGLDLDELSPRAAHALLAKWQQRGKG